MGPGYLDRLQQIVVNLLTNAVIKFTPPRAGAPCGRAVRTMVGRVIVETREWHRRGADTLKALWMFRQGEIRGGAPVAWDRLALSQISRRCMADVCGRRARG